MGVLDVTGIAVTAISLLVAIITFVKRRPKARLEYVVLLNSALISKVIEKKLAVTYNGDPVESPTLSVVRIANTGERVIREEDFDGDLLLLLEGVRRIVDVSYRSRAISGLEYKIRADDDHITLKPVLLNPADIIEFHVITSGAPQGISIRGHIAEVTKIRRRDDLPYPPGSGSEGEMIGTDKVVWIGMPIIAFGLLSFVAIAAPTMAIWVKGLVIASLAVLCFAAYPLQVRYLVRRRRAWRP